MRKVLVIVAIAIAGAGVAALASTVLFSEPASDRDAREPRGLVVEVPTEHPEATGKPSASPKVTEAPTGVGDPAPVRSTTGSASQDTAATERPASGGTVTTTEKRGVVVEDSLTEGPCDDEDNERDRERCEDRLEREADREEDEAEADADEDDD